MVYLTTPSEAQTIQSSLAGTLVKDPWTRFGRKSTCPTHFDQHMPPKHQHHTQEQDQLSFGGP
jgi:hypothetical protein